MKPNIMFLSLFIAAFLFSSLGSVRTVKATTAQIDVCKSQVKWNDRLDQVKNGDRRTYMGCLAEKLTNTTMPADVIRQATQAKSNGMEGCFVHSYKEGCITTAECKTCVQACSKVIIEGNMSAGEGSMHMTSNWGDVPPDSERRNTIACLEDALR